MTTADRRMFDKWVALYATDGMDPVSTWPDATRVWIRYRHDKGTYNWKEFKGALEWIPRQHDGEQWRYRLDLKQEPYKENKMEVEQWINELVDAEMLNTPVDTWPSARILWETYKADNPDIGFVQFHDELPFGDSKLHAGQQRFPLNLNRDSRYRHALEAVQQIDRDPQKGVYEMLGYTPHPTEESKSTHRRRYMFAVGSAMYNTGCSFEEWDAWMGGETTADVSQDWCDIAQSAHNKTLSFLQRILSFQKRHQPEPEPEHYTGAEAVAHPAHYNTGNIEVIDFIEDQGLDFNLGNVVKYVSRAAHKGHRTDDLRKALWYLQRELNKCNT